MSTNKSSNKPQQHLYRISPSRLFKMTKLNKQQFYYLEYKPSTAKYSQALELEKDIRNRDKHRRMKLLEENAKHIHQQFIPLKSENTSLKDHIIAINFYIQQRCIDFALLVKDKNSVGESRELIKKIGDLVTIHKLLEEDIKEYEDCILFLSDARREIQEISDRQQLELNTIHQEYEFRIQMIRQTFESQIQDLEWQLKTGSDQIQKENERLNKKVQELQNILSLKEKETFKLNEQLENLRRHGRELDQDHKKEMQQLEKIFRESKEGYQRQIKLLKDDQQRIVSDTRLAYEARLESVAHQHQDEQKQLQQKILELYNTIKELELQNLNLENDLANLKQEYASLRQDAQLYEDQAKMAQARLNKLVLDIQSREKIISDQREQITYAQQNEQQQRRILNQFQDRIEKDQQQVYDEVLKVQIVTEDLFKQQDDNMFVLIEILKSINVSQPDQDFKAFNKFQSTKSYNYDYVQWTNSTIQSLRENTQNMKLINDLILEQVQIMQTNQVQSIQTNVNVPPMTRSPSRSFNNDRLEIDSQWAKQYQNLLSKTMRLTNQYEQSQAILEIVKEKDPALFQKANSVKVEPKAADKFKFEHQFLEVSKQRIESEQASGYLLMGNNARTESEQIDDSVHNLPGEVNSSKDIIQKSKGGSPLKQSPYNSRPASSAQSSNMILFGQKYNEHNTERSEKPSIKISRRQSNVDAASKFLQKYQQSNEAEIVVNPYNTIDAQKHWTESQFIDEKKKVQTNDFSQQVNMEVNNLGVNSIISSAGQIQRSLSPNPPSQIPSYHLNHQFTKKIESTVQTPFQAPESSISRDSSRNLSDIHIKKEDAEVQTDPDQNPEKIKQIYDQKFKDLIEKCKRQIEERQQQADDKLNTRNVELEVKGKRIQQLQAIQEETEQKLATVIQRSEELQNSSRKAEQTAMIAQAQLRQKQDELDFLKIQMQKLEERVRKELQLTINQITEENEKYKRKIGELQGDLDEKQQRIINMGVVQSNLYDNIQLIKQQNIDDIESLKLQHQDKINEKNAEADDLRNQIKTIQNILDSIPSRPDDLLKIKQLERDNLTLRRILDTHHQRLFHATEIVKYLQLELENYKNTYNIFQNEGTTEKSMSTKNLKNLYLSFIKEAQDFNQKTADLLQTPQAAKIYVTSMKKKSQMNSMRENKSLDESTIEKPSGKMKSSKKSIFPEVRAKNSNYSIEVSDNSFMMPTNPGDESAELIKHKQTISNNLLNQPNLRSRLKPDRSKNNPRLMFVNPLENYDLIRNAEQFVSSLGRDPKSTSAQTDEMSKTVRDQNESFRFKIKK